MLEPSIRQIAIHAIASRASGTTVEAAFQILEGISVLDHPEKPFVVWPADLSVDEQIEALEAELKRIRHAGQAIAEYWSARRALDLRADSGAGSESPGTGSPAQAFGGLAQEAEAPEARDATKEEAHLLLSQRPDREASDASQ
jgi:hypothetical protein